KDTRAWPEYPTGQDRSKCKNSLVFSRTGPRLFPFLASGPPAGSPTLRKLDYFTIHGRTINCQPGYCDRQCKPARPRAARIEKQDFIACLNRWPMRVTTDDGPKAPRSRMQVELFQIMQHVDQNAIDLYDFSFRNRGSPYSFVVVSANRHHGSDGPQLFYHLTCTNVTGMKNQVNT